MLTTNLHSSCIAGLLPTSHLLRIATELRHTSANGSLHSRTSVGNGRIPQLGCSDCFCLRRQAVAYRLVDLLVVIERQRAAWYVQGWLGAKDNVLHFGEGPIPAIQWSGSLVAWANNLGVKVRSLPASLLVKQCMLQLVSCSHDRKHVICVDVTSRRRHNAAVLCRCMTWLCTAG